MNIDKTAMLAGWLIGREVAAMMLPKKKLVGYSYNGVVLPTLPEIDRTEYPYVYIFDVFGAASMLCYSRTEFAIKFTDRGTAVTIPRDLEPSTTVRYTLSGDKSLWRLSAPLEFAAEINRWPIMWSDTDVYYANYGSKPELADTLFLAKSDPVPVYE